MPTYEYECTKCGGQFEYLQSIKDAPKDVCEQCGGELVKLLSAGTGLIFKGSGFYITDYKAKSGDESGGAAAAPAAAGGGSAESGAAPAKAAESKPAAPAATGPVATEK
jgi:putative FmdB family regulatory protein